MFRTCKRNLQDSGTLKRVAWGLDVGTRVWSNQYKSEFAFSLPLNSFIYYCFIFIFKLFYLNQYLRNSLLREFITWIESEIEFLIGEISCNILIQPPFLRYLRPFVQQGSLHEEVYMVQPLGLKDFQHLNHVCKLHKAIYGLRQALRVWHDALKSLIISYGFITSKSDLSLFKYTNKHGITYFYSLCDWPSLHMQWHKIHDWLYCLIVISFFFHKYGHATLFLGHWTSSHYLCHSTLLTKVHKRYSWTFWHSRIKTVSHSLICNINSQVTSWNIS